MAIHHFPQNYKSEFMKISNARCLYTRYEYFGAHFRSSDCDITVVLKMPALSIFLKHFISGFPYLWWFAHLLVISNSLCHREHYFSKIVFNSNCSFEFLSIKSISDNNWPACFVSTFFLTWL